MPVRRGCPMGIGGLTDVVNSPMYATGVGARHVREAGTSPKEDLSRGKGNRASSGSSGELSMVSRIFLGEGRTMFELTDSVKVELRPEIKVIGIGGAGGNAVQYHDLLQSSGC